VAGILWLLGVGGTYLLSGRGLLVANVNTTVPAGLEGDKVVQVFASPPSKLSKPPCGDSIVPALYAAELIIPVLNLHQVGQCEIGRADRPSDDWVVWTWEIVRAFYLFFATIGTSLAFLTFSGIARRWERTGS